jgi:uncharacterized membrane protein YbhN (UPF0104 family)
VQPSENSSRKWLWAAVKLLIVALVVWFIRGTIAKALADLGRRPLSLAPSWLAVSGCLYLLGILPEGLFWHRILIALGQRPRLSETLRAYYIGHLGKYVPGKALVVVLRTGLIRSQRVETGPAVAGVFLSTLTMMSVGALLAAAILALGLAQRGPLLWASLAVLAVAGLPTLPPVFSRLARWGSVGRANPAVIEQLARLSYKTLLAGWLGLLVGWALMGASLWAALRTMGIAAQTDLIRQFSLDVAAVALGVVGGFVSMIPGGAVTREAIVAELLSPQYGGTTAISAAVLLRLVWLVAELAISGILYFTRPTVTPTSPDASA